MTTAVFPWRVRYAVAIVESDSSLEGHHWTRKEI